MRTNHDLKLLKDEPRINIILGGHDHITVCQQDKENNNLLMKSGSDFREFGLIITDKKGKGEGGGREEKLIEGKLD